jgi:hypothetical protein
MGKAQRLREQRQRERVEPVRDAEACVSLHGPRSKVDRAKEHIGDLEAVIQEFFQTGPYKITVKDNPETDRREWIVDEVADLPARLALITGDAVHNLRSALDHLIWQLVIANGGEPDEMRTEFPVWRDKTKFEAGKPGNAKGISKGALKVFYGLKPYKGGNEALWLLSRLDIIDKHRLVLAVGTGYQSLEYNIGAQFRALAVEAPSGNWPTDVPDIILPILPAERYPIEPGVAVFGVPLGDTSHDDVKFRFEIAFEESDVREGEPVLKVLGELAGFVNEVIDLFAPHAKAE